MKLHNFIYVALLVALLVAVLVVPWGSAGDENAPVSATLNPCGGAGAPAHCILPEYFADAKTPAPLSEAEMITIVISRQTFERFVRQDNSEIVAIPVVFLDFTANFSSPPLSPTWHYEKGLAAGDPVAAIRMPDSMYDRFMAGVTGDYLELPVSTYVKEYDTLSDLEARVGPDGAFKEVAATGANEPGSGPVPTLPAVIVTTPRTQPADVSAGTVIVAIGCICIMAFIHRRVRR